MPVRRGPNPVPDEEIRVSPFSAMDGGFIFFVSLMGKIEKSLPPLGDGRGGAGCVFHTNRLCKSHKGFAVFTQKYIGLF